MEKVFNKANIYFWIELSLFVLFCLFIVIDFICLDLEYTVPVVISMILSLLSYLAFSVFCIVGLVTQILNKSKTIIDKILLGINIYINFYILSINILFIIGFVGSMELD